MTGVQTCALPILIPDFDYLIENKDRVKGIFITHGHDDVMKALTHVLRVADFEVYATALTAKVIDCCIILNSNNISNFCF